MRQSLRAKTVKVHKSKDRDWLIIKGGNKISHTSYILKKDGVAIFYERKHNIR